MIKSKKGLSVMIGYIFLIVAVIVISFAVYQWMESYIPKENLKCPDGVELDIIEDSCAYTSGGNTSLNLTFKNKGRFNILGYYIYASNISDTETGEDISKYLIEKGNEYYLEPGINFGTETNAFKIGENDTHKFNIQGEKNFRIIKIVPMRVVESNNKNTAVMCSNAQKRELVNCD